MRISDWSSDVCSSDLLLREHRRRPRRRRHQQAVGARVGAELHVPVERAGQIAAAKAPLLRSGRGLEAPAIQSPSPAQREREARSEEHTSELQSLMRTSYAVFCLKKHNNMIRCTYTRDSLNTQK